MNSRKDDRGQSVDAGRRSINKISAAHPPCWGELHWTIAVVCRSGWLRSHFWEEMPSSQAEPSHWFVKRRAFRPNRMYFREDEKGNVFFIITGGTSGFILKNISFVSDTLSAMYLSEWSLDERPRGIKIKNGSIFRQGFLMPKTRSTNLLPGFVP